MRGTGEKSGVRVDNKSVPLKKMHHATLARASVGVAANVLLLHRAERVKGLRLVGFGIAQLDHRAADHVGCRHVIQARPIFRIWFDPYVPGLVFNTLDYIYRGDPAGLRYEMRDAIHNDGKLDVLRVACRKCDRSGQYPVTKLIERYGPDTKLPDWRDQITGDCHRRANDRVSIMDLCGAWFPDLMKLGQPE